MMTKKYKILCKYIKDLSSETPDIETYLYVKEFISKYKLGIDITSKALKNKMIEINTKIKFEDQEKSKKKSYFEIIHATVIKVQDDVKDKEEFQKIILVNVQNDIYPDIEKSLLNILHNSGYQNIKFSKKIDFEDLYQKRFN